MAPAAMSSRNSSVLARSSASDSALISGSSALISATRGRIDLMRRSLEEPKILRAMPPRLTIHWSFQSEICRAGSAGRTRRASSGGQIQQPKAPEIGSGRKDEGQIRGGRTDVNAAEALATSPESAVSAVKPDANSDPSGDLSMRSYLLRGQFVRMLAIAAFVVLGAAAGRAEDAPAHRLPRRRRPHRPRRLRPTRCLPRSTASRSPRPTSSWR